MKLKTPVTIVTLTVFSMLLTKSSIAYACEEEDSTPAQSLKTIRDEQSGLVFEVASNYRAVAINQTKNGVWKAFYIMEPTAYCYWQSPNITLSSKALLTRNYAFIEIVSTEIMAFLNQNYPSSSPFQETSINQNTTLIGGEVVAVSNPNGQYWVIIYDATSDHIHWLAESAFPDFSYNNQVLLHQIYKSIRWNTP